MGSIGQNIRELRELAGKNQEELAEAIGVNRVTLSKYESDAVVPGGKIIARLADVFQVSSDIILGRGIEALTKEERELWEIRNAARQDAERRILFMLAKNGSSKDVKQVVAIIDALKATNPDFYEGDDPA